MADEQPYDPKGQTFAPPHVYGDAQKTQNLADWTAYAHNVTPEMVDELRMPPSAGQSSGGAGNSNSIAFGNQGTIDPAALRASAGWGHYDVDARRNAIAAQVLANQQPVAAPAAPGMSASEFDDNYWRMRNYEQRSLAGW